MFALLQSLPPSVEKEPRFGNRRYCTISSTPTQRFLREALFRFSCAKGVGFVRDMTIP
jgi:hypothetical protein